MSGEWVRDRRGGVHIRGLHDGDCPQLAGTYAGDLADVDCPPGLRHVGRALARRHTPIVNWATPADPGQLFQVRRTGLV